MNLTTRSLLLPLLLFCALTHAEETNEQLARQVRETESAFAATMAKRDLAAFSAFLADEAVFFGATPLRGKAAVIAGWKAFFEDAAAPFSWAPETVEVLASGTLAHSSGPVFDPQGKKVATFNSIWRRDPEGQWKIVFDKGCQVCACKDGTPE